MTIEDFNLTDKQINFLKNRASREVSISTELANLVKEEWQDTPKFQKARTDFLAEKVEEMLSKYLFNEE